MAKLEPLGIKKIEALHYYVNNLQRSHKFYVDGLDFSHVATSTQDLEQQGHQRSEIYQAGRCMILCSEPIGEGGRAWRYLRKHPDGIGTIVFEVEDVNKAFRLLEERGGTPINDVVTAEDDTGKLSYFAITTPFGDTTFRFVQRTGFSSFYPGMRVVPQGSAKTNAFEFVDFDHITSNFQTMKPALLWLEHVLGCEQYWHIEFHTDDVKKAKQRGSGLRSQVFYDPYSGVKFANNEPFRPFFKQSQINIFNEQHRGDGVQHVALEVANILSCVRGLRARQVSFMPTPQSYYDVLPQRLKAMKIGHIDEDIAILRDLQILVDGEQEHSYLLQIFLKEAAGLYQEPNAGPFFYEIIQRKGDRGFGGGNFRALFESIERTQQAEKNAC